jgi:hypothetical protein
VTQAQYNTAKDLVLDLLGWGVLPEYLVDCGLSREIVYYVFKELNLRLPTNLDTTGIVEYPPFPHWLLSAPASPGHGQSSMASLQHAPDSPGTPRHPGPPNVDNKRSHGVMSASSQDSTMMPRRSTPSLSPPPAAPVVATNSSLHDMEQQKRQVLLARKAVQASRRPKEGPNASSTAESQDQDVEMAMHVPEESVEDFLKSIGPVQSNDGDQQSDGDDGLGRSTVEPMDVDVEESTPGFVVSLGHEVASVDTDHTETAVPLEPLGSSSQGFSRRGTKRPVASDFVDFESAPHVGNGNESEGLPVTRRKAGSFASVSGMRRCVIDLSDSEDDGGGGPGVVGENGTGVDYDRGWRGEGSNNGWATPPSVNLGGRVGAISPAALVEKEEEIRKMRELIAQRERSRLKKLAMVRLKKMG